MRRASNTRQAGALVARKGDVGCLHSVTHRLFTGTLCIMITQYKLFSKAVVGSFADYTVMPARGADNLFLFSRTSH